MIRTLPIKQAFVLMLALFVLSACGAMEWPPPDDGPRSSNRPQATGKSPSAFVNATAVIVGKGDTVYGLSKRHRVSARALIDANNLRAPYVLSPGQRLILPRAREYVVQKGDYLGVIAQKTKADMYAIARLNALKPPYTIYVGQRLVLPNASRTAPVSVPVAEAPPPKRSSITARSPARPKSVPAPPTRTGKGFAWPLRGRVLSNYGGKSAGLKNDGINIAAPRGAPRSITGLGRGSTRSEVAAASCATSCAASCAATSCTSCVASCAVTGCAVKAV